MTSRQVVCNSINWTTIRETFVSNYIRNKYINYRIVILIIDHIIASYSNSYACIIVLNKYPLRRRNDANFENRERKWGVDNWFNDHFRVVGDIIEDDCAEWRAPYKSALINVIVPLWTWRMHRWIMYRGLSWCPVNGITRPVFHRKAGIFDWVSTVRYYTGNNLAPTV